MEAEAILSDLNDSIDRTQIVYNVVEPGAETGPISSVAYATPIISVRSYVIGYKEV
jgi:hypothetical protein